MREVVLPQIGTVAAWRATARRLASLGVPAEAVVWRVGGADGPGDLFVQASETAEPGAGGRTLKLPREAIETIERALCHADPERFARAYAILLNLKTGTLRWGDHSDPMLHKLMSQAKVVAREIHKMHAFVRFREVSEPRGRRRFAAWFEPEHHIVEAAAPFFARRFGDMDWAIATPTLTAIFQDGRLRFEPTAPGARPTEDSTEGLWRTYYAAIFNPARLMVRAMQSEMPKKYWRNLPEAQLIPDLIRSAPARVAAMAPAAPDPALARRAAAARRMVEREAAMADQTRSNDPLAALRHEAAGCTRCPLHQGATQTVFGEGPPDAPLMIVGEQPGDQEDLSGRPFVGPAGAVFDEEAAAAGLDRSRAYVTNAVKHFKFTLRGKRRIHQRPDRSEISACRWWLDREREVLRPKLILSMGATALAALTGSGEGILKRRGGIEPGPDGLPVFVTVHPSYILRLPDEALRAAERARFRADLAAAAAELARHTA